MFPLLKAMHEELGGTGRLFKWAAKDRKLSRQIQRHLQIAGVTRADLFADDASRKPMTFHDLRATGITWCACRGDDPLKIKQRAGHATFSTTEGYIREAENLGGNFGGVFPPCRRASSRILDLFWVFGPEKTRKPRENSGAAGNRSFLYGA